MKPLQGNPQLRSVSLAYSVALQALKPKSSPLRRRGLDASTDRGLTERSGEVFSLDILSHRMSATQSSASIAERSLPVSSTKSSLRSFTRTGTSTTLFATDTSSVSWADAHAVRSTRTNDQSFIHLFLVSRVRDQWFDSATQTRQGDTHIPLGRFQSRLVSAAAGPDSIRQLS